MILNVNLWDNNVGALFLDIKTNNIYFEFNPDFIKLGLDISPVLMPISNSKGKVFSFGQNFSNETFKNLPPVFADSLPDKFGSSVLAAWLKTTGKNISDLNSLERLSYIGNRGMGALEYFPDVTLFKNNSVNIEEIVKIADAVLNDKINTIRDLNSIHDVLQIGTSAGGMRPKAIISINDKTNQVVPGDILQTNPDFKYYILKIDGVNDQSNNFGKIEFAYYKMAKLSGIDMSDSKLYHENERAHFMTERFDRVNGQKLHMQTLCSLANMNYNDPFSNSYEQAFGIMNKLNLEFPDIEQQYRRMVFNVIAKNMDDHTKNISFLMNHNGKWKLSPAYDISYAYEPNSKWISQHQMSINGKRKEITFNDLFMTGSNLGIRNRKIIINQVVDAVSQWSNIAKDLDIPELLIKTIDKNILYNNFNLKSTNKFKL